MGTFFDSHPEIQVDGLHTNLLMSPYYTHHLHTQPQTQAPPPLPPNYLHLNSTTTADISLPSSENNQFLGIPIDLPRSEDFHGQRCNSYYDPSCQGSLAPGEIPPAQKALSLSLAPWQPGSGVPSCEGESLQRSMQAVLLGSKYMKASRELLDEIVCVTDSGIRSELLNDGFKFAGEDRSSSRESSCSNGGGEPTAAERQELQAKKAKFYSLLLEVEQRYRHYHQRMQVVTSSFDHVAGAGSSSTYTALALKTMSRQFRCLKDAILYQIKVVKQRLGEEDGKAGGSRLRFVDYHFRQQMGGAPHNAWRPQRGLPERSVSILRAWLFEHFLHPYPKDSEKHMLAKQTGLTRSQVSNWFINARVRLWKPMVEEMYLEEIKEQEHSFSDDKITKSDYRDDSCATSSSENVLLLENKTLHYCNIPSPETGDPQVVSFPTVSTPLMVDRKFTTESTFARNGSGAPLAVLREVNEMTDSGCPALDDVKFGGKRGERHGYTFMGGQINFIGEYPMEGMGRFEAEEFTQRFLGNGVSLSLGLPHCENLPLQGTHHAFLADHENPHMEAGMEIEETNGVGAINASISHPSSLYESMDIQNPKRFAPQLLHDFVA